uniref:Uncharacterized protein n=1 Tax=Setaria viridis TaxID=4556 RepID=A0A4U6VW20_SETVI|nr:hypothetical protein SEVIR_2G217300v2 [Setaria viridis]
MSQPAAALWLSRLIHRETDLMYQRVLRVPCGAWSRRPAISEPGPCCPPLSALPARNNGPERKAKARYGEVSVSEVRRRAGHRPPGTGGLAPALRTVWYCGWMFSQLLFSIAYICYSGDA